MDDLVTAGTLVTISLVGNVAIHAFVVKGKNSDGCDWRRCSRCGQPFAYGGIAQNAITQELICYFVDTKNTTEGTVLTPRTCGMGAER